MARGPNLHGRSIEPPKGRQLDRGAMAALFQQLAAGAPSAPLDEDEPAARILTNPGERDRVLEDHYNLMHVRARCRGACAGPP